MNTQSHPSLLSIYLATVIGTVAIAQDHTLQIRHAHGLQAESDRLVGGGPDYKVEFHGSAVAFTPAMGENAPRELPLRFTLESIRRGSTSVFTANPASQVNPRQSDNAAFFQHTPEIREVYDVRVDGIEQSFVFAERLAGSGDLVVRGRLETDLTPDRIGESARGFLFSSPHGAVKIGAVTGVDARGARCGGTLRFDGTHLDLVLPGSFVTHASYPLVLDPLIGVDHLVGGTATFDDGDSDVAYDVTNDEYCVVWSRAFSNTSQQIRAQRFDASGTALGGIRTITLAGVNVRPTVANVNVSNRYLIAWQHATNGSLFGPHDIQARAMSFGGALSNGVLTVAATAADETEPDAGNDSTVRDDEALLVWSERGHGIRGVQVRLPVGTGNPTLTGSVQTISTGDDHAPAISKGGGPLNRHCVVWHRRLASTAVFARLVNTNLIPIGAELPVATAGGIDEEFADVDGDGTRFMIVWEQEQSAGSTRTDIECRTVSFDGTRLVRGPAATPLANSPLDERTPAIGLCGPKFVVSWAEQSNGFANYVIVTQGIGLDGCNTCGPREVTAGSHAFDSLPQIATAYSSGSVTSDDAWITFTSSQIAAGTISDIRALRYSAIGNGGPTVQIAPSCGTGGTLTVNGAVAIGNRFSLDLAGADPLAQVAVLHLGSPQTPATCGSCAILAPFLAVPVMINGGAASVQLPVDCAPGLIGSSLFAQYALAFGSTTPCPLAPTVSLSNIVSVTFGY